MRNNQQQIQQTKEWVMKKAAKMGFAIHRIEKKIIAMARNGTRYHIISARSYSTLWHDAKKVLSHGRSFKKMTPKIFHNLLTKHRLTGRDKMRMGAITLAFRKKGLTLFHRGNSVFGFNRYGRIINVIKGGISKKLRPKENIWKKVLKKLTERN